MGLWKAYLRRVCRKHGHAWDHVTEDTGMCYASRSTCKFCGFVTYRYWEDSHR